VLLLEREGCVDEGLSPAEVEAALLRQIKAADALKAHLALQAWSDVSRITPPATTGAESTPPPAKAPRSRNTKKKSTRSKKKKIAKKK